MKFWYLLLIGLILINCKGRNTSQSSPPQQITKEKEVVVKKKDFIPNTEDSLDIKIGQMILIGLNDRTSLSATDSLRLDIKSNKIGGVIIFEKNIAKTN